MTQRAPLFISGVHINQFRGYGTFSLEIPARPCVVILSGPNGLGKTSLFEAIEWGLTGAVKRLDQLSAGKLDARDLARKAVGVDAFEVSLSFRDVTTAEERVTRTQLLSGASSAGKAVGTDIEQVLEILRSDEQRWSVTPKNLPDYLHLTHLHAQVASLRLVTFSAKDRWIRVSPLAGADRFERVRTNLTNSKAALTRLRGERAAELTATLATQKSWLDRLTRLEQLRKLASASHDMSPPKDARLRLLQICKENGLEVILPLLIDDADASAASDAISRVRRAVESARSLAEQRLADTEALRTTLPQWQLVQSQAALVREKISANETTASAGRSTLLSMEQAIADCRTRATHAEALREATLQHQSRVLRGIQDRADAGTLAQELCAAEKQLQDASDASETADLVLRERREKIASREKLVKRADATRQSLEAIELAIRTLSQLEPLRRRAEQERERSAKLGQNLLEEDARISAVLAQAQGKDELASLLSSEHARTSATNTSLQMALVAISEHVHDADTTCPVCKTTFAPGALRNLATTSASILSPRLAELEGRLVAVRAEQQELRALLLQLNLERRKIAADLNAVRDNIVQIDARILEGMSNPLLKDLPVEKAQERLEEARTESSGELRAREKELSSTASAEELKAESLAATSATEACRMARSVCEERRNARKARLEELRARILADAAEHPELNSSDENLHMLAADTALAASKAREAAHAASMRLAEIHAKEVTARKAMEDIAAAGKSLREQLSNLERTATNFQLQWEALQLGEQISELALDGEGARIGERMRTLSNAHAETLTISQNLAHWQRATDVQTLERDLRQEGGGSAYEEHTLKLANFVVRAEQAHALADRARTAADDLSSTLTRVTSEFGGNALKPFGDLFRRYVRAMLHDERFHSIQATYEPSARGAGLSFKVDLGGSDTEAEYILSEGQLGEVSLAAMLAASSAFPWSRWRALLLDDPTQYNDLIHATSLFDVLRNLVRFAHYQVFVSTHDNEQASFLRRKLEAVGIPWVDCRYVAHTEAGISVDVRRSSEIHHAEAS